MKITPGSKVRDFIFAAAFCASLGFGTSVNAQVTERRPFLIDFNSKTVTEIGTLGDGYSVAAAINDAGQVVGYSAGRAFITGPNGVGIRDLGTLGGRDSGARGINAAGQVVGWSDTAAGSDHAFITGPNGMGMRDLGALGAGNAAWSINNSGQVAGTFSTAGNTAVHAFVTGPNGVGMKDLHTFGGSGFSEARGINEAGQVVGQLSSELSSVYSRAFITSPDGVGMRDRGTLDGTDSSFVNDINNAGQVVGISSIPGFFPLREEVDYAFITGPDGMGMTRLATFGGTESAAFGINDAGQVVGVAETGEGTFRAYITGPNGTGLMDLDSLVHLPAGAFHLPAGLLVLDEPIDINNTGQVLASGIIAVPEPETYVLFLAGLVFIGFMARRKKMGGTSLILE